MTSAFAEIRSALATRVERGELDLPMLPDVAAQIISLSGSDDASAAKIADILHRDPSLAGHVLRIANSPAYIGAVKIVSLQQAISRLGLTSLREISVAASIHGKVFKARRHESLVRALWRHSVGAAAFAREIARVRKRNVEGAFLAGLLHDIGGPILLHTLDEMTAQGPALDDAEIVSLLDEFHAAAGTRVATSWKLPTFVCRAIEFHHTPGKETDESESVLQTSLANHLAHALLERGNEEEARAHAAYEPLNLYPEDVAELFARKPRVVAMVESLG